MATMRVAQVSRPGGPLELVERPIPDPGPGSVRIKVQACGVCHSDAMTKEGLWPGITFPRVPGHEVVGVIDAVGFTVVALAGPEASVVFMQAFGVIYLLTGVIGCLTTGFGGNGYLLGLVHLNTLDNFLHLGLGVVIGAAGWYLHARPHLQPER